MGTKRDIPCNNATGTIIDTHGHKDITLVAKCALVIGSIYFFYLLNNVMNFCQVNKLNADDYQRRLPFKKLGEKLTVKLALN